MFFALNNLGANFDIFATWMQAARNTRIVELPASIDSELVSVVMYFVAYFTDIYVEPGDRFIFFRD